MRKYLFCLVLFFCFTSVAFAQSQESKYVVTITYSGEDGEILTEKINVLSTSASEAENKATRQWEALKQTDWTFKFANAERENESVAAVPVQPVDTGPKITKYKVYLTDGERTPAGVQRTSLVFTVEATSNSDAESKARAEWRRGYGGPGSYIISIDKIEKIN